MILILCFVQYFFVLFVEIISGNAMPDAVVVAAITAHFLREIYMVLRDNTALSPFLSIIVAG
jgi:hypothetical protein